MLRRAIGQWKAENMTATLDKSCTLCGDPATGYRNTATAGAAVSGAHWEARCEVHNPYDHMPSGGWPQRSSEPKPLRPGDGVALLPGAPIRPTVGVDAGARGQVLRTSLEPGSQALGVSWVTVRFDRWGACVPIPRAYLQYQATP